MSKILLLDYENDHDYELIGIHTSLEDYRLAFFLNNTLSISLNRLKSDLKFDTENESFPLYVFDCEQSFTYWSLISNKYNYVIEDNSQPLFSQQQQTSYLIQEKKQIDFFLKIEGDLNTQQLEKTVSTINNIKNIITSYSINPKTLKSKDFLIF